MPAFGRRLDATLFAYKAERFARAVCRSRSAATQPTRSATSCARPSTRSPAPRPAPQRFAHRDFQSQNLHPATAAARAALAMIDLQGAFLAPPEYDLVCLLRDSYVELPDDECAAHRERVRPALPDAPAAESSRSASTCSRSPARARTTRASTTRARAATRVAALRARHARATLRAALARVAALDARLARLAELPAEAGVAMRAMIVAAGLGTRLRPLSTCVPKPALPVRGIPLVAYPLAWLARHGVREVVDQPPPPPGRDARRAERWAPPGLRAALLRRAGAARHRAARSGAPPASCARAIRAW